MGIRVFNLGLQNIFFSNLKYFWLSFIVIWPLVELSSQIQFTTLSGQILVQSEKGDYIIVNPEMTKVDTIDGLMLADSNYLDIGMEMLVIDQNPISAAYNKGDDLTEYEIQLLKKLELKAMANEVSEWKLSQLIAKQINAYEISLSQAKMADNVIDQREAGRKLEELSSKLKANQRRYQNTYRQIIEIRSFSLLNTKDRNQKISVLARDLDIPIENDKLTPSPKMIARERKLAELRNNNCQMAMYSMESKSFKIVSSPLFDYTPEKFKSHLKTIHLLQATVALGKEKNKYILYLDLSLQNKEVAKSYGEISPGYQVIITFNNGQKLSVLCTASPTPSIEPYTARSLYKVRYAISSDDVKRMKRTPIDKVSIQYSSGYETYTVYEVDVLMHQASCLDRL